MDRLHPDGEREQRTLVTYKRVEVQAEVPLPGEKCPLCNRKVPKPKEDRHG
jgi:DNA repair exonuclease SbcCD ATPase subunit